MCVFICVHVCKYVCVCDLLLLLLLLLFFPRWECSLFEGVSMSSSITCNVDEQSGWVSDR